MWFTITVLSVISAVAGEPTIGVIELTDANFDNFLWQNEVAFVLFTTGECLRCYNLVDTLNRVGQLLRNSRHSGTVARVDCTSKGNHRTCQKVPITVFPTMKLFKNGRIWKEYDRQETPGAIYDYVVNHVRPGPVILSSQEELDELIADEHALIGFFRKGPQDNFFLERLRSSFTRLSDEIRGLIRTGYTDDKILVQKYNPNGGVVFFRNRRLRSIFEPDTLLYDGDESALSIKKWFADNEHGLVGIRTPYNVRDFHIPLVIVFYELEFKHNAKHTSYWRNRVLKVANYYRKLNYSFAISSVFGADNDLFHCGFQTVLTYDAVPVVCALTERGKYKMEGPFSEAALWDFMDKINTNRITPFIRSEKSAENNTGHVKILTGNTFNELVTESDRDSFIMLYSENNPSDLFGTWDELALALDGEDVDVMKMNVLKNDRPAAYELKGYPTVYWVPKGVKSSPVLHTGGRKLGDLIAFVSKFASVELRTRSRDGLEKKGQLPPKEEL